MMKAEKILKLMASRLLEYLEELADAEGCDADGFRYGEKTAYAECLAMVTLWDKAERVGLDAEAEEKYLL